MRQGVSSVTLTEVMRTENRYLIRRVLGGSGAEPFSVLKNRVFKATRGP
jgi:hypothetical protein